MNKIDNFVFIIGAMKCGTTSLFEYLAQHPQISPCTQKEPNFFSNEDRWNRGFEWYFNLWEWQPSTHKIALEASVNYSKIHRFPYAASRIASLNATCKFIYIVRDPLDRIESHYVHGVANRWEGCDGKSIKNKTIIELEDLIETSKYAKQLTPYTQLFSKENILIVSFEDLKNNRRDLLKRVYNFLNIQSNYEFELNQVYNQNKGRTADHALYFYLKKNRIIRDLFKVIPSNLKQQIRYRMRHKVDVDAKLSQHQKKLILNELESDLTQLRHKYDFYKFPENDTY